MAATRNRSPEGAVVAQERYTRTNQKLYFAGLAIKALREAEQGAALDAAGRSQAEREAALFHLHGALLGLLQEIAGFYRLPGADAPSVEPLLGIASDCPELGELRQLAARGDSWLSALREAHAGLFVPPVAPRKPAEDNGLIVTSAAQSALPVDGDTLAVWQAELKALALRFREAMVDS